LAKPGLPLFGQTCSLDLNVCQKYRWTENKLEKVFYADYPVLIFLFIIPVCWGKKHIQAILQQDDKRSLLESHPSMLIPAAVFTLQTLLHAT